MKKPMKVFTSGGITSRSACGRMISPVFCQYDSPSASAASYWPLRQRLQPAAHDLGQIGGGEQNDRHLRAQQLVHVRCPPA